MCLVVALLSCNSEWDEFKKYTKNGEIIYTGKFDSVVVFPGKERVKLWGTITRDPKVERCKIFWDNFKNSAEFEIDPLTSEFMFDEILDVAEGTKSFTVYTYDAEGNSSIGVTVTGTSYGTRYRNTLNNRKIKSIAYDDAATTIYWDLIDKMLGPVQMEVTYKIPGGDTTVITPATESTTVLKKLDFQNDGFTWRTVFKPLPLTKNVVCIDTFWTKSSIRTTPNFVQKELDRSLFAGKSLTGDTWANGGAGSVPAMWDNAAQNSYGGALFTDIGSGGSSPQMVTMDLGMKVDVTKLVVYPFQEWWGSYYVFSTIRDYEIYGSENPSASGALDESWTLLTSGTIEKISGGAKDSESAADKAAAVAGFTLNVNPDVDRIRYIRIRCLRNYEALYTGNSNAFFSIAEIRVFGMLPE